jgi:serine/threonine-protein kinase
MPPEFGTVFEREQRLEDAVLAYLKAADGGQAPDPQALFAQHPEFTEELTAFLDDQDRLDHLLAPLRGAVRASPGEEAELRSFGDYEVLQQIGRGGMGVVYQARQVSLNRIVALKMIGTQRLPSAALRARFQIEAQAGAQLHHPNIVRVYASGEHNGRPYLTLEFVPGASLGQSRAGRLWSTRAAAKLVARLARAVDYAHQQGILHRDLKPSNVLVMADGTTKITDFGLAKQLQPHVPGPTLSGEQVGTPAYMAPEQARGQVRAIGPATDIFGLGAILYDLLTGRPPFVGAALEEVLAQARQGIIRPPGQLNARVPLSLDRICMKALAIDPHERYPSAAALGADLRRHLLRPWWLMLATGALAAPLLAGTVMWLLAR